MQLVSDLKYSGDRISGMLNLDPHCFYLSIELWGFGRWRFGALVSICNKIWDPLPFLTGVPAVSGGYPNCGHTGAGLLWEMQLT